ncbi:MAG TPA: hypothetical protein VJT49_15245 [Amycolatopsis sp.]|uniref:hypothetical protein n=1 Tax=Amycolatopsis sp. TaxID=37632 RepID=UPI002B47451F|nr:hypothetical protein [Amycolatopsis sp.]HKS46434.1 hypothetical protein [Amycolatopsis sp.]
MSYAVVYADPRPRQWARRSRHFADIAGDHLGHRSVTGKPVQIAPDERHASLAEFDPNF